MSDLTELLNYSFPKDSMQKFAELQASNIGLENARRAQQERMDLKALFAKQPNPSFQAVGAIDPTFAIEQQKAQMQLIKDQIEMANKQKQTEQIKFKMGKEQQDLMMKLAAATIDEYDRNIEAKMPQAQALDIFNRSSSRHLSESKQRGIIPPEYPSFDPESMNPEALRIVVKGQGFPTEKDIRTQEYQKNLQGALGTYAAGLPPQKPVKNEITREWETPPSSPTQGLTNATPTRELQVAPGAVDPMEGYARVANDPSVPEELRAIAAEKAQSLMPKINAPKLPMTAEQERNLMVKQAAEKEAAITTAKQQAEEQQAVNKSLKTYETLPDINHIRDLVKGSIGSDLEYWTNRLGRTVGESLAAGDFQAALAVVASDMASTIENAPGPQSDKDLLQKLKRVGNLDATMTMDEKMAAVDEWFQGRQRYIGKYGKYSDDELIALGREGKITQETALKVRANRNKGQ